MKDRGASVRLGWYLALFLALGGYAAIVAPAERHVTNASARAHDLYEMAQRDDRLIQNLVALDAQRRRVQYDIARAERDGDSVVGTIGALQRLAKQRSVVVTELSEERLGEDRAGVECFRIVLEGRYRDVLAVVEDLPRQTPLTELRSLSVARSAGQARLIPSVDATVDAAIYRTPIQLVKETDDRPTR